MKNLFLLLILSLSCAMWSCGGSSDNTSVKDVVALIDKGAEQQDSIDNGTLDISDIPEADYFNTPTVTSLPTRKFWQSLRRTQTINFQMLIRRF